MKKNHKGFKENQREKSENRKLEEEATMAEA
jgi:hypothetical protein